jgi:hypothetical protein
MLGDEQARKALGASGREYANEWSSSAQAKRMLSFYNRVRKLPQTI